MKKQSRPPTPASGREDLSLIKTTALELLAYARGHDWAGFDPYDALNGRLLGALPFLDSKWSRLLLTQAVKRCPVNLRPALLVPQTPNPKGLALFLSALIRLTKAGIVESAATIEGLADRLLALRSPGSPAVSWGYNFDWQTRTAFIPRGSPNIICSSFAAQSLMDAFEHRKESEWLDFATRAAEFLLEVLFYREGSTACFSYTPVERTRIHNANLLGAALLCRIGRATNQTKFMGPALDAARYSAGRQRADGSWAYGELPTQRWVDNFHTGFNLVALRQIGHYGATAEFEPVIRRGLEFYRGHFFKLGGMPAYYHNATYPIDIHSVAQSILTLWAFRDVDPGHTKLAFSVFRWALQNMWDARGFFYYQKRRHYTARVPFMRWSQAWMLLALATILDDWPPEAALTESLPGSTERPLGAADKEKEDRGA
jgi:hypothetical protein